MSSNIEQSVIDKLKELPPEKQHQVLAFMETLLAGRDSGAERSVTTGKSIWEEIEKITREAPEESWEQVPTDGAAQHDHYLYGAPKK